MKGRNEERTVLSTKMGRCNSLLEKYLVALWIAALKVNQGGLVPFSVFRLHSNKLLQCFLETMGSIFHMGNHVLWSCRPVLNMFLILFQEQSFQFTYTPLWQNNNFFYINNLVQQIKHSPNKQNIHGLIPEARRILLELCWEGRIFKKKNEYINF